MAVVKVKVLKPATLKIKEMRLELLNGLRSAARAVERDYKLTTATWEHQPKFETIIAMGKGKAEFLVGTDDEIYRYVDEGTKPHMIFPVNAQRLRFQGGYSAKTQPGVIGSSASSTSGGVIYSKGVFHPGTKARRFSEVINKKHERLFKDRMHEAMRKARAKSGHAI